MMSNDPLNELAHIRGLMDRSTRFLSLSGLSGVVAGAVALVGAYAARAHHKALLWEEAASGQASSALVNADPAAQRVWWEHVSFLLVDGATVLLLALLGAFWFTWRRSRRMGQGLWDASARRMAINLFVPLAFGGLFALALVFHGAVYLLPAATLLFYGLGLLNAAKYTLDEIRWLGLSEASLGVVAAFWADAGLLFWALGFGVLHILYGGIMYMRHERSGAPA